MDFRLTEEQQLFRDTIADFVDREVIPVATEMDEREEFPWTLFRRAAALGLLGVRYPEKYGGVGTDFLTFNLMLEELSRGSLSLAAVIAMQGLMGTDFIYRFATEEQKERLLVPAIRGEKVGSIAMTEPGAGSDLGAIRTTAVRDGDGYRINGTKMWITSATAADFFTVAAKTNPDAGFKGVDLFLVEKSSPGVSVGKQIKKLGVRASETAELILEDVRVPATNLLGGSEGRGTSLLRAILNEIRVITASMSIGLARAALDAGVRYAQERQAFGRPIIKFQAIEHKLAEMATRLEAARALTYHAIWLVDQGQADTRLSAMAKLFASETANYVADETTRIYGSYGFAMEYDAQRYFRDARFLLYGGGTSELLRGMIGRELSN
ncbi:MAG: acyl-CoA dehydrogenase family protein [Ardenticatenaceae bacterium]|nr:acyl-CoA dehydrogenase family protein [Ardenticatenaceae bacterium]HBY99204.1 acyl-CoA dehydrogenase [Chloroflexota bacterium]